MTHEFGKGVIFSLDNYETVDGREFKSSDHYYADVGAAVLRDAFIENYYIEPEVPEGFNEKQLLDRLIHTSAHKSHARVFDHEVPAFLGMCRIALDRMADSKIDNTGRDTRTGLPVASVNFLAEALEKYENERPIRLSE